MSVADVLDGRARWTVECADCIETMGAMPDRAVAHVITDPPYEAQAHTKARRTRAAMEGRGSGDYAIEFAAMTESGRAMAGAHMSRLTSRWALVFCQVEAAMLWRGALGMAEYVRTMVWDKPDSTPQLTGDRPAQGYESIVVVHGSEKKRWNAGGKRGVYRVLVNPPGRLHEHPTEKPLDLMLALVSDFTDPADIILDPFAGSGTTGVAAIRLGRRCILIEKQAKYVELIRERLEAEERMSTLTATRAKQEALF